MKKITWVLVMMVALGAFKNVNAQKLDFGIKGGVNGVKIDAQSFRDGFNYGFVAGPYLHIGISKKLGIGSELLFSQAATKPARSVQTVIGSVKLDSIKGIKLNYLGIPLTINYGNKFKIQAGAQFNVKLNESESVITEVQNAFKSSDMQALVGFHWNLPLHLFVNGRYLVGLADINDLQATNQWKSQTIQATVGLRF